MHGVIDRRSNVDGRLAATVSFAASLVRQVALVDRVLSSSAAASAASALGTDIGRVRAALPALSDAELQDLARRATALDADPVAGLDDDIRTLLIIFLIVAIVIMVLKAVD